MKKSILVLVSLVLFACLLVGCGAAPVDSDAAYQSAYNEGYSAGYKAAKEEFSTVPLESSMVDADSSSSSSESQSEEPVQSDVGTRKNPVPLGTEIQAAVDLSSWGKGIVALTVSDVVRGQDAADMVADANMFNSPAPDGLEFILAKVTVSFIEDQSGKDSPLKINYLKFKGVSSSYAVQERASEVLPDPKLDAEIYEGASDSGWVLVLVPEGDTPVYMIFEDIWFALS